MKSIMANEEEGRAKRLLTFKKAREKRAAKVTRAGFDLANELDLPARMDSFLASSKNKEAPLVDRLTSKSALAAKAIDQFLKRRGF